MVSFSRVHSLSLKKCQGHHVHYVIILLRLQASLSLLLYAYQLNSCVAGEREDEASY